MESEIGAAVTFLKRLLKLKNTVQEENIDVFCKKLTTALQEKYQGHWDCENPIKGQAYRCVRVNDRLKYDPELLRACKESGIEYSDLGLPCEITLWVDPGEVCGRYGEENYYFPIATFPKEEKTHSSGLTVPNGKCCKQIRLRGSATLGAPKNQYVYREPCLPIYVSELKLAFSLGMAIQFGSAVFWVVLLVMSIKLMGQIRRKQEFMALLHSNRYIPGVL